jgi:hypothetical protein
LTLIRIPLDSRFLKYSYPYFLKPVIFSVVRIIQLNDPTDSFCWEVYLNPDHASSPIGNNCSKNSNAFLHHSNGHLRKSFTMSTYRIGPINRTCCIHLISYQPLKIVAKAMLHDNENWINFMWKKLFFFKGVTQIIDEKVIEWNNAYPGWKIAMRSQVGCQIVTQPNGPNNLFCLVL